MKKNYFNRIPVFAFIIIFLSCAEQKEEIPAEHISHLDVENPEFIKASGSPAEVILSDLNLVAPEKMPLITELKLQGKIIYDERKRNFISSKVSGRIENLNINYNFQEIKKGSLIMEIYSPELVTAQREYLLVIKQKDKNLQENARLKLLLNGFPESLISKIENINEPLYRIPVYSPYNGYISESKNDNELQPGISQTPVLLKPGQYIQKGERLFNIYDYNQKTIELSIPSEYSKYININKNFLYKSLSANEKWNSGKIDLLLPVQQANGNFYIGRTYIKDENYKNGELIQAIVPVVIPESWWIPAEAVYYSGTQSIVFKWEKNSFRPVAIETGIKANGYIQVLSAIDDWKIAQNGSFLVDSESLLKIKDHEEE